MTSQYSFKLIILGASGVGKTCIVQRYCNDVFEGPTHKTTLGFDFLSKKTEVNGNKVDLEVWDTAGQEQYRAVAKMYYRDVHGVILVYDITEKNSFDRLKYWMDDLEINGNKIEEKILVGSKVDREVDREVSLFEAKKFATERGLEWTECSAKTGDGVIEMFNKLVEKIIKSYNSNPDFKALFSRSTVVTSGDPISTADAKHRANGYKLDSKKVKKKSGGCC